MFNPAEDLEQKERTAYQGRWGTSSETTFIRIPANPNQIFIKPMHIYLM